MSQNPFKTPEFNKLFNLWNQVLEKEGFDVEDFSLPDAPLKNWDSHRWNGSKTPKNFEETRRYYELAEIVGLEMEFKSRTHEQVWDLFCQGMSVRMIANKIRKKDFTKTTVHRIIVEIQRKSGLRND